MKTWFHLIFFIAFVFFFMPCHAGFRLGDTTPEEAESKPGAEARGKPTPTRKGDRGFSKHMVGIGLNYPGVGLRYFFANHGYFEARVQAEGDILSLGGRAVWIMGQTAGVHLFTGLEGDRLSFESEHAKGDGVSAGFFLGGERFVSNRLAVQLDVGIYHIRLEEAAGALEKSSTEPVVNFGINYYMGGSGHGH